MRENIMTVLATVCICFAVIVPSVTHIFCVKILSDQKLWEAIEQSGLLTLFGTTGLVAGLFYCLELAYIRRAARKKNK
jgi:hypothetical protein